MLGLARPSAVRSCSSLYVIFAKNSPKCPPAKSLADYMRVLQDRDAWWFMFFYSVSFGGFVGLSSSLPIYFHDQYGLSPVIAGYFTAACVFAGSLVRPSAVRSPIASAAPAPLSTIYASPRLSCSIVSLRLAAHALATLVFMIAAWRRWAWATARCSSWCRNASAAISA